jgi:hypothetical protein
LVGEQFRLSLGPDLVHVLYNGSSLAVGAVLAGQTPLGFTALHGSNGLAGGAGSSATTLTSPSLSVRVTVFASAIRKDRLSRADAAMIRASRR